MVDEDFPIICQYGILYYFKEWMDKIINYKLLIQFMVFIYIHLFLYIYIDT